MAWCEAQPGRFTVSGWRATSGSRDRGSPDATGAHTARKHRATPPASSPGSTTKPEKLVLARAASVAKAEYLDKGENPRFAASLRLLAADRVARPRVLREVLPRPRTIWRTASRSR